MHPAWEQWPVATATADAATAAALDGTWSGPLWDHMSCAMVNDLALSALGVISPPNKLPRTASIW